MMKIIINIIIFFVSGVLLAQNNPYFVNATTGGASQEVEIYDDYLFVGNGSTFSVFYIGNNNLPPYQKTFEYRFKSRVQDFKINNNYLYIASNHDGISKWDLSTPETPQLLYEYEPDSLREAAFDIEILNNDTIIVAYGNKVSVFLDNGNMFQIINQFGYTNSDGIICGGALKDSMYAYVKGQGNLSTRGAFIYNAHNFNFISYYHQDKADPEDLVFGDNTDLLHVFGGTYSANNPLNPYGYYYCLDISDITQPKLKCEFDILGLVGVAIANAINGVNVNDTIYVATSAGINSSTDADSCYIYVYDATDTSDIHLISKIYAGLWHFDVCKKNNFLFIASEWYGIKTIDLTDFLNYADVGNTPTGGWNTGCDLYNNKLIIANEGYGFSEYDISNPYNLIKIGENHNGSFCHIAKFSADGQYIYAFYSTGDGVMVYDAQTLNYISSVNKTSIGDKNAYVNNNVLISLQSILFSNNKKIYFFDITNPNNVQITDSLEYVVNDIKVYNNKLYVSTNDSIVIYDISSGHPQSLASYELDVFNDALVFDVYNDTIYCYISGIGAEKIGRFVYDNINNIITFDSCFSTGLSNSKPKKIAVDSQFIYLAYNLYGVRKYDRQNINYLSYYKSGLDYKELQSMYGVTDLICKNNYILLSEYFGQTTLLTNDTNITNINTELKSNILYKVYPNPASETINIKNIKGYNIKISDISGKIVFSQKNNTKNNLSLNISDFNKGIYFINFYNDKNSITKKIIIY